MSSNSQPGNVTLSNVGVWDETFLSDRDVSGQIPINYVPHPGVYLSQACFGTGRYIESDFSTCLSDLLSSQIQRFVLDLYWDSLNREWNFCPVQIPPTSSGTSQFQSIATTSISATTVSISSSTRTESSTTSPNVIVLAEQDGGRILQLGPYVCSDGLSFSTFIDGLSTYISMTSNIIQAKLLFPILNLHVASTWQDPTTPQTSISPSEIPTPNSSVASYLGSVDQLMYTLPLLLADRQNLNTTWYDRSAEFQLPITAYYSSSQLSNGDFSTDNGWPDENYIQVFRSRRLLMGFGTIDPILANYTSETDLALIYPPGYIYNPRVITYDSSGYLTQGCYYTPSTTTPSQLNNSWAVSPINAISPPDLGFLSDNLTTCGISPLLNTTISGLTADNNSQAYTDYGRQSIFSWAYGEPRNDTTENVSSSAKFRCALAVANSTYSGHWKTEFCAHEYRAACRIANQPYLWTISARASTYGGSSQLCPANSSFDVPRTGLENAYLTAKIQSLASDPSASPSDQDLSNGVWINFNCLSYVGCWVTTGPNGTCPYVQDVNALHDRQVLIPAIAALIVLVLTALTILAKCSNNVRSSRVRKRGEGGWDYEGVPS